MSESVNDSEGMCKIRKKIGLQLFSCCSAIAMLFFFLKMCIVLFLHGSLIYDGILLYVFRLWNDGLSIDVCFNHPSVLRVCFHSRELLAMAGNCVREKFSKNVCFRILNVLYSMLQWCRDAGFQKK
eukprot:RCo014539